MFANPINIILKHQISCPHGNEFDKVIEGFICYVNLLSIQGAIDGTQIAIEKAGKKSKFHSTNYYSSTKAMAI
jgi:hypothetical protein